MPTIKLSESIEVSRPIDEVYATVVDPRQWVKGEQGLTIDPDSPMRAGSAVHAQLEVKGRLHDSTGEITDFEPPHRFGLRMPGEPLNLAALVVLTPNGQKTRVTVEIEVTPSRWVFGLSFIVGGRFMRRVFAKVVHHKLVEFKTEVEAA